MVVGKGVVALVVVDGGRVVGANVLMLELILGG